MTFFFQHFLEEALRCLCIFAFLHQDVDDLTVLIDRTPEIELLAVNRHYYAFWLYHRFSLSFRDVEELLAERRIIVSREAIRNWRHKFGPAYAKKLRQLGN